MSVRLEGAFAIVGGDGRGSAAGGLGGLELAGGFEDEVCFEVRVDSKV